MVATVTHQAPDDRFTSLRAASRECFFEWAREADALNCFPERSIECLRELGLMRSAIPQELGGLSFDIEQLCETARLVGQGCLSTALVWSMHTQQLATLTGNGDKKLYPVLRELAKSGALIASVTTERGKGGDLFQAHAALQPHLDGTVSLARIAPIVSYGRHADWYLLTLRASEIALENDVRFVLLNKNDGVITAEGDWHAMGVRGTQSVPMEFSATVSSCRVLASDYRMLVLNYFVPVGQMLWSASWFGCVEGLFFRLMESLFAVRKPFANKLKSDLFVSRVGDIQIKLKSMQAMLALSMQCYSSARKGELAAKENLIDTVNALKVYVSEQARQVVDDIMVIAGFASSYLADSPLAIERIYRDILSARLMFSNDVLRRSVGLQTIGALRSRRWQ
jgi:acyl-CoA dehydrogenase